jgi:sec-independent protein translocase protein TatB
MNFLGVGPLELVVILVVALVFVGPERLPKLAADIARTIREIRKYTGSLAAEFNEVIQEFEKDTAGERSSWKDIEAGITGATKSVTDAVRDVKAEVRDAQSSVAGPPAAPAPAATSPAVEGGPKWVDISSGLPPPPLAAPSGAPGTNGALSSNGHAVAAPDATQSADDLP